MKRAIYFSIDNNYVFSQAILFLSFRDNSPYIFNNVDFIIFHNGISNNNMELLNSYVPNLQFIDFRDNSFIPPEIYHNPNVHKWGECPINTLFAYDLIKRYDQVLHLDSDMMITGEIDKIFNYDCDIACFSNGHKLSSAIEEKHIGPDRDNIAGHTILFNASVNSYNIGSSDLLEAYKKTKSAALGGACEERIMSCLASWKDMKTVTLPNEYSSQFYSFEPGKSKIIHFVDRAYPAKPWKNPVAYLAMPDWHYYYRTWRNMGGSGPEIEHGGSNLMNPGWAYNQLKSVEKFCRLANRLDIVRNSAIRPDFNWKDPYWYFHIQGLPAAIRYYLFYYGRLYKIGLQITDPQYFTTDLRRLVQSLHDNLPVQKAKKAFVSSASELEANVVCMENYLNNTFNLFLSLSLAELQKIFACNVA